MFENWPGDADDITIAGVLLGIAYGVAGALALLSVLAILHHCFTLRQRRRQQREYLASKLKDEDDRPFKHNGGNYLYQQWPPCLPEMVTLHILFVVCTTLFFSFLFCLGTRKTIVYFLHLILVSKQLAFQLIISIFLQNEDCQTTTSIVA